MYNYLCVMYELERSVVRHKCCFTQNVVDQYPAIKKLSSAVGKHVTLLSELSKRVTARLLLETSECEQTLVCQEDHAGSLNVRLRVLLAEWLSCSFESRFWILDRFETHI